jgi:hypothetical protein
MFSTGNESFTKARLRPAATIGILSFLGLVSALLSILVPALLTAPFGDPACARCHQRARNFGPETQQRISVCSDGRASGIFFDSFAARGVPEHALAP